MNNRHRKAVWLLLLCFEMLLTACGKAPAEPVPIDRKAAEEYSEAYPENEKLPDRSLLMEQAAVVDDSGAAYQIVEETKAIQREGVSENIITEAPSAGEEAVPESYDYVLNKNSLKFHDPECESVQDMNPKNRLYFSGTREDAVAQGYTPCGRCKP